jgi:hypothetical protein
MFKVDDYVTFNGSIYRVTATDEMFVQLDYKKWIKNTLLEKVDTLPVI